MNAREKKNKVQNLLKYIWINHILKIKIIKNKNHIQPAAKRCGVVALYFSLFLPQIYFCHFPVGKIASDWKNKFRPLSLRGEQWHCLALTKKNWSLVDTTKQTGTQTWVTRANADQVRSDATSDNNGTLSNTQANLWQQCVGTEIEILLFKVPHCAAMNFFLTDLLNYCPSTRLRKQHI